jgi:hypothetical protein
LIAPLSKYLKHRLKVPKLVGRSHDHFGDPSGTRFISTNYLRAALQRISPRCLAFLDFPAQMNLVYDYLRQLFGDMIRNAEMRALAPIGGYTDEIMRMRMLSTS